jgi:hypothetical protein
LYWQIGTCINQGQFLPATVDAELEFDSVKPPPDTIEEEDEGQQPIKHPTFRLKQLKT